jgi:lipid-binding SYLF domain-containing protein
MINLSIKRVGGLTFVKVGRLTLSFSVAQAYQPIGANAETKAAKAQARKARQAARRHYAWLQGLHYGHWEAGLGRNREPSARTYFDDRNTMTEA